VQLVIGSLEALYNISGVGQTTSDHIASVDRSVGMWSYTLHSCYMSTNATWRWLICSKWVSFQLNLTVNIFVFCRYIGLYGHSWCWKLWSTSFIRSAYNRKQITRVTRNDPQTTPYTYLARYKTLPSNYAQVNFIACFSKDNLYVRSDKCEHPDGKKTSFIWKTIYIWKTNPVTWIIINNNNLYFWNARSIWRCSCELNNE